MTPSPPPTSSLWPRLLFLVFVAGLGYLALQLSDLMLLRALATAAAPGSGTAAALLRPTAYVPLAKGNTLNHGPIAGLPLNLAEVGDGGDLGRRARAILERYQPLVLASVRDNVSYVALAPLLRLIGGELHWSTGQQRAAVLLPDALVSIALDGSDARRNYRPVPLPAVPLSEYGQLKLPVKALGPLFGLQVELLDRQNQGLYRLVAPGAAAYIVVRERMYSLEASRSGRWLRVYFLGQPIKRYPICTGEGNNTPVGQFHIANKAVWPPWNAYWGEHMPGGSSRNPLGARWLGTTARGRATGRVIGIHGTNQPSSIGRRISGGCMRMYNHDAIELYNNIPVGTPLSVHE